MNHLECLIQHLVEDIMEFRYKIQALFKYLKSDWELLDYPIRYRTQEVPFQFKQNSSLKMFEWTAQIIIWWSLCGDGNTKEEAFESYVKI